MSIQQDFIEPQRNYSKTDNFLGDSTLPYIEKATTYDIRSLNSKLQTHPGKSKDTLENNSFKGRGPGKGPIWNYFKEDKASFNLVYCTICQGQISRGRAGYPG